jgi:8-oxo-dGTP pyrophosphatase MutT (NUDIX family)
MRVVGMDGRDAVAFDAPLSHGADPDQLAYDLGFVVQQPIDASRDETGDIRLRLRVARRSDQPRPVQRLRGRDAGLVLDGVTPVIRQRLAAYAVVQSERGLLATQYSDRTAVAGRWGMPGGGVDDDEEPMAATLREVAEETSQLIGLGDLIKVQTSHWVGRSPRGGIEDFHAVRLIYRGTCPAPTDPVVIDQGGTTESARWVPLSEWTSLPWTRNWQIVLAGLLE